MLCQRGLRSLSLLAGGIRRLFTFSCEEVALLAWRAFHRGRNMIKHSASQFFVGEIRALPLVLPLEARM